MPKTRATRSQVLGKRGHRRLDSASASSVASCDQLETPDPTPNPKRVRTSGACLDGDCNKENVPPYATDIGMGSPPGPRVGTTRRRAVTEAIIPSSSRGSRRSVSASINEPATPTADALQFEPVTPPPTPPTALLPIHARARVLLRSTCNDTTVEIAGRETERATILQFFETFISNAGGGLACRLYISGSPGTGKTALTNEILRTLNTNRKDVKTIFINCMALASVDVLWERLAEDLAATLPKGKNGRRSEKGKGKNTVASILPHLATKCILVLDELDHIAPNSNALSNLFSMLDAATSRLCVVGIANTHTLTAPSSSSVLNVQTLHFAPYNPAQLLKILQSRLGHLASNDVETDNLGEIKQFLPAPTLNLLTRKIAAMTGDVRSLFEVLRGAIDIAVTPCQLDVSDSNPLDQQVPSVTPTHVLAALKAYTPSSPVTKSSALNNPAVPLPSNSEIVSKVHNLGLQPRLALLAILLASKRFEAGLKLSAASSITATPTKMTPSKLARSTSSFSSQGGGSDIETGNLYSYYRAVLDRSDSVIFSPVTRSEFGDLLGVLEGVGLVSLSSSLTASASPGSTPRGRRTFSRTSSFGGGLGRLGAGSVGEVRLAEGVWADEVLRGLGVSSVPTKNESSKVDAMEEEVKAIWSSEQVRMTREVKATAAAQRAKKTKPDAFEGATED